jgi:hypothetical protein
LDAERRVERKQALAAWASFFRPSEPDQRCSQPRMQDADAGFDSTARRPASTADSYHPSRKFPKPMMAWGTQLMTSSGLSRTSGAQVRPFDTLRDKLVGSPCAACSRFSAAERIGGMAGGTRMIQETRYSYKSIT